MKARCYNKKLKQFKDYGGRGIYVDSRWLLYENFYNDNINRYMPNTEIDRIDNNGIYSLLNTRWVTVTQQARNKRNVKLSELKVIEIRASKLSTTELMAIYSLDRSTINRVKREVSWVL